MGGIAFASPFLLAGLLALPLIWWLLRTTPPGPKRVAFPPTRILADLISREKTPARSPWWLTVIRMLAAAAVVLALAEPVLNPTQVRPSEAERLAIVVDNGWAAADRWELRAATIERLIEQGAGARQATLVFATASASDAGRAEFSEPGRARDTAAGLRPQPWLPDRAASLERLTAAINAGGANSTHIVWLSNGLGAAEDNAFADSLVSLVGDAGAVTVLTPRADEAPVGLTQRRGDQGALLADVRTLASDVARSGSVRAVAANGQQVASQRFALAPGSDAATVRFALPLEIRNQISRLEINSVASAGAVALLDARSQWRRVGLIAAATGVTSQPLLSPLYYLRRALTPFTDVAESTERGTGPKVRDLIAQRASTLVLANIGTLDGDTEARLDTWVQSGGVLVRFAGSRLEQGADKLIATPLRFGGRTLGGALSWSEPQRLAPMDEDSLFAGISVPQEVVVRRQVLADPTRVTPQTRVWAQLQDGTPLVTARQSGKGWLILFHTTANSDWSNLPLSGAFVDMMRRILTLGGGTAPGSGADTRAVTVADDAPQVAADTTSLLAPRRTLDGRGVLGPPPPTAKPVALNALSDVAIGPEHPPGYYGATTASRALNAVSSDMTFSALSVPAGATAAAYEGGSAQSLKPWLFALALGLLLLDALAVLLLGGLATMFRRRAQVAGLITVAGVAVLATFIVSADDAVAQTGSTATSDTASSARGDDAALTAFALEATTKTRFAYVLTGDAAVDDVSRQGLSGLRTVLARRTAVEAGEPVGVDPERDELAFFPILYWPVTNDAEALSGTVLAKVDAYMKTGGMVIFDTRDQGNAFASGGAETPLQRLIGTLDVPRLEPVPANHVLTKSFYLLDDFPGRWSGGDTWVEAGSVAAPGEATSREAQQSDGVTSIIVTSHDLAAAWAVDDGGRPLFAVVPGGTLQREMAYRTGVNIVMYALTGNYKADQVHVPDLLRRLGQ
ncbi:MAG: DUF4159 domain-containing protein [Pseudomonadota bacterium]